MPEFIFSSIRVDEVQFNYAKQEKREEKCGGRSERILITRKRISIKLRCIRLFMTGANGDIERVEAGGRKEEPGLTHFQH